MGLRKDGLTLGCENCAFAGAADDGAFEVRVPVADQAGAFSGDARIRCEVSLHGHQLTLVSLQQMQAGTPIPTRTSERVQGMLDQVAGYRVCGNEHVCPSEVVDRCRRLEGRRRDGCDPDV
ncbi:MAG: hypothetical protein H6981_09715 [Gammaproteobacteria bacterium]|nr:hypothetical protein [Gammaproteobacteria bacterium]MCP5137064.1 hypothetical protein [Gammaproteobacteria bacterium]